MFGGGLIVVVGWMGWDGGGGRLLHYWRDFWKKKTTGNEERVLK